MKIDLIISSLVGGGAERVVSLLANKFADNGHEVRLFTFDQVDDAYLLDPRIKRIKFEKRFLIFNYTSVKCLFFLLWFYRKKNNRPNIISSHMTLIGYATIPIAKLYGIKVITTEHINHLNGKEFVGNRILWRLFYPIANAVTVLTKYDLDFFKKINKNTFVVHNPSTYNPISLSESSKRDKIILTAGNLDRFDQKGFDNLMEIAKEILPKFPDWKLKIVGGGEIGMKMIKGKIQEYNLTEQVILTGFRTDVDKIMQKSEIYLLPSRYEGLPMVLIEAMSQNMVCVSYDCISGPSEIIKHNYNGILVKDQDQTDMVMHLNRVMADKDLRRRLRGNINGSLSKFSLDEVAEEWEKLFRRIL
tara:strand:+ start:5119 stop:6198 length:1080 start_codon:yes stop_codon:yes gene_type:complete